MELFELELDWQKEWRGMPEFIQNDLTPWKTVYVHFEDIEAIRAFAKLVEQPVTTETRSLWYPKADIGHIANKRWVDSGEWDDVMSPDLWLPEGVRCD